MYKSFIAKNLDIKDEDLLLMIPELCCSIVSCFGIKGITKNVALVMFRFYFGILVLLTKKKAVPLSYHIKALFINKKDKYLYR